MPVGVMFPLERVLIVFAREEMRRRLEQVAGATGDLFASAECWARAAVLVLRQAQHERKIRNDFKSCPVRPELVEG